MSNCSNRSNANIILVVSICRGIYNNISVNATACTDDIVTYLNLLFIGELHYIKPRLKDQILGLIQQSLCTVHAL